MRQFGGRAGRVALFLSIIIGMAACGGGGEAGTGGTADGTPREGGTLRVAMAKEVVTLDPALALDNYSQQVVDQIFDTLTTTGADDAVEPRLATEWKGNDDSTVWDFTLREGVKFQNGRDLTADDVVWTMERLMDADKKLPRQYLPMVEEVTKTSENEVQFSLKESYAPFPSLLSNRATSVVPRELVEGGKDKEFARNPVGSGPFKFTSWTPEGITLDRNPDYFFGRPRLDKVVFTAVPETAVAQQSLLTGDKDVISDTLPTDIPRLQQDGLLQVTSGSNFSYVVFNQHPESAPIVKEVGKNPFTDAKVREAITLSFDVDAAVSAVYPADLVSTIRAYGPVPNTSWAYDKTLPDTAPKPDVNRAKQLLAEAGYPNGFKTELLVVNDAARVAAAQIFQNALSQIGIEASISTPQIGQILERANSQTYDIGIFGWGGLSSDPDYYVEPLLATANRGPGGNNAYYSNPEVDGLIRETLATSVREDRKQAFDQIQQIVQRDYVFIPLFYQPAQLGVAKKVKDLKVASDKMYRLVTEDANVWISE